MSKFNEAKNDPSADSNLPASSYTKHLGLRIGESEREAANARINRLFSDGYLGLDELELAHKEVAEAKTQEQLDKIFDGFPAETAQMVREKNSTADQAENSRRNLLEVVNSVNSLVWPVSVLIWAFLDLLVHWEQSWAVFVVAGVISTVTQIWLLTEKKDDESSNPKERY